MEDKSFVIERLAPALASHNLKPSAVSRADVDYIGALGYAARRAPLVSHLLRLYLARDWKALGEATRQVEKIVAKEAKRARVDLASGECTAIARAALRYCAEPVCPNCHGRKFQLIPGSRMLGDTPCNTCGGDGRRPLPARQRKLVNAVVKNISQIESGAVDAVFGRL